ncbi:Alpha/Beta hydrolase protein [Stachybotrys elegans]|uniref:Alpha/Beta hydrolase protein n=1 Tax=Stachybotrys elegans TaxID=80388 RepID=A0A8K0WMS7_9HYPO|nr:Alpha/Beta hydrolase protein [Stachybotrys elegans]
MYWLRSFGLLLFSFHIHAARIPLVSQCSEVSFRLAAVAENVVWSPEPDLNDEGAILDFYYGGFSGTGPPVVGTETLRQNLTIEGMYCRPAVENQLGVLQVLVHGISYNKTMWSGLGFGGQYDWHAYANNQGYHTLAIDRVAHGTSTEFPDPLEVVQGPMIVETLHQVIAHARTQPDGPLQRTFDKVAIVAHSYGGWVATGLAIQHPDAVDALVLTGFSNTPNHTVLATSKMRSAAMLSPERFSHLPLGYITTEEQGEREANFYHPGGYDTAIPLIDYEYQDTWSIGQTGNLDFAATSPVDYRGHYTWRLERCEEILRDTRDFYPNVSRFGYFAPENTGHALTLHYTAALTARAVHDFLLSYFTESE